VILKKVFDGRIQDIVSREMLYAKGNIRSDLIMGAPGPPLWSTPNEGIKISTGESAGEANGIRRSIEVYLWLMSKDLGL
jgi:hypothetical protein